jgi:prevent-host-death family protein
MVTNTIGIYEAKNRLSELLDRVEAGEIIAITRHGKQIALLTPVNQQQPGARQAIDRLRQIRKGSRLGGLRIKELRDEGRP